MTELMSSFRNRFSGRPAAVLGGGPSLPADMEKLPEGCLMIAVNYHYTVLTGKNPDFTVFNDHLDSDLILKNYVEKTTAVRVSPDRNSSYSDVEFDVPVWTGFFSSNTAAWFALWLGCDPVILCGMDCYQGEAVYCHPSDRDCPAFHYPLDHYLRPWIEEGKNLLDPVERVKVMSGPLTEVFGAYA
jgi:hypothetical protein